MDHSQHFEPKTYAYILDIVQKSLSILSIFLVRFLGQNVQIHPDQNVLQGAKYPNTPKLYTTNGFRLF